MTGSPLAAVVEAVAGLRWRGSCRRFDTLISLPKDELVLEALWLLEKLPLDVSKRLLNMVVSPSIIEPKAIERCAVQ